MFRATLISRLTLSVSSGKYANIEILRCNI